MYCHNCGRKLADDQTTCPACEISLSPSPAPDLSSLQIRDIEGTKILAGVLGIVLGSLGVHKFVLGYNFAGLIMLAATLLTCGMAGGLMGLIGLIEGIIYLTRNNQIFYQTYILNKRPWF